jgi:hypothetical protein
MFVTNGVMSGSLDDAGTNIEASLKDMPLFVENVVNVSDLKTKLIEY